MTKTSLLAFERARQRFQRAIVHAAQDPTATTIIKQSVNGLLQHALLVSHDDFWRTQLHQLLQTVVAVDYATIKIVQVRSRKASTIEWHERAKLWRNHRNNIQDHPLRTIAALQETVCDLQPLGEFQLLLLRSLFLHPRAKVCGEFFNFDRSQKLFDSLSTHLRNEHAREVAHQLAVTLVR